MMSEPDEMAPITPDDQLMLAFADGDAAAFDRLYERHENQILHFVRRVLGLRLAGEVDLVFKQTWALIIDERRNFPPLDTWVVWALGIAYGRALERLRRTGSDITFFARDAEAEADADGLEAARLYGRRLQREDGFGDDDQMAEVERVFWNAAGARLLACIERLPDEERAAFLLYQEEGFTVDALAEVMRFDDQTARGLLRRSLKKLRDGMETYLAVLGAEHGIDDEREEDELLRDRNLRRALDFAPDAASVPEWETRNALLAQAHEGAGLDEAFDRQFGSNAMLQPRSLDGGRSGHGLRWAGLAVLVAAGAGWFWLRYPTPIAQVERGSQVATVISSSSGPAPAPAPDTPSTAASPAAAAGSNKDKAQPSNGARAAGSGAQAGNAQPATPPAASRAAAAAPPTAPVAAASPPVAPAPARSAADSAPEPKSSKSDAATAARPDPATRLAAVQPAPPAPPSKSASSTPSTPAGSSSPSLATPPATASASATPSAQPSPSATPAASAPPPQAAAKPPSSPSVAAAASPAPAPSGTGSRLVLAPIPTPDPAPAATPSSAAQASAAGAVPKREAKSPTTKSVQVAAAQQAPNADSDSDGAGSAGRTPTPPPARSRTRSESAVAMLQLPATLGDAPRAAPSDSPPAAIPVARTPPSNLRTDDTEPPTFAALSQWTRLTISRRGGPGRTVQRADAPDLISLLGSAAIAAVGPKPLAGAPDWRITLERNNEVLAVLEVASTQVRWREGHAPPATGVPSGLALAGLRVALSEAIQEQPADNSRRSSGNSDGSSPEVAGTPGLRP